MEKNQLTAEQIADIKERVEKAAAFLKELELACAVQTTNVNLGGIDPKFNGVFGTYLQCFLQDLRYAPKQNNSVKSPITPEELAK